MTDDYWDSQAPLAINQRVGKRKEEDRGEQKTKGKKEEGKYTRKESDKDFPVMRECSFNSIIHPLLCLPTEYLYKR